MSRRLRKRLALVLLPACGVIAALIAVVWWLGVRGERSLDALEDPAADPGIVVDARTLDRGRYLARAGNCLGCHTTAGGEPYAGGRGTETPFGTVFAPNITPDSITGIGNWSSGDFWRAMHHGRSRDGRLLYPAFPYPSFTQVTRADSDAIYWYLRSLPAVDRANLPHALRFPYDSQLAVAIWRALFFRPGAFRDDPSRSAGWNRGKYLVEDLGHCAACHSARNVLGGVSAGSKYTGGLMPDGAWYAPSLTEPAEAGVTPGSRTEVVKLMKTGVSAHGTVTGPMAGVVYDSTQYLSEADLDGMVEFLSTLPPAESSKASIVPADGAVMKLGGRRYEQHCAGCHGERGQGVPGIYPALAGNRAVTLESPTNVIQIIRRGGLAPRPRPAIRGRSACRRSSRCSTTPRSPPSAPSSGNHGVTPRGPSINARSSASGDGHHLGLAWLGLAWFGSARRPLRVRPMPGTADTVNFHRAGVNFWWWGWKHHSGAQRRLPINGTRILVAIALSPIASAAKPTAVSLISKARAVPMA